MKTFKRIRPNGWLPPLHFRPGIHLKTNYDHNNRAELTIAGINRPRRASELVSSSSA